MGSHLLDVQPRGSSLIMFAGLCLLLVGLSLHGGGLGMSGGAPGGACDSMTPQHNGIKPQEEDGHDHYVLKAVPARRDVYLTLEAKDTDKTFKGFVIQARDANDPDKRIGTFTIDEEEGPARFMGCSDDEPQNAITHRSPEDKTLVNAIWTAPSDFAGEVEFRYSVAQSYGTFYTGLVQNVNIAR